MNIDFNQFSQFDFDKRLMNSDNQGLLNSEVYYVNYKRGYVSRTRERHARFNDLQKRHHELADNKKVNGDDITFVYTDPTQKDIALDEIKAIVQQQREDTENFKRYVNTLVTQSHLFTTTEPRKHKGLKSVFAFNKKKGV